MEQVGEELVEVAERWGWICDKLYMYMHSPPYLYRFCVQETLAVKSETSQRQLVRAGVKVTGKVFMVAELKVAPGP